MDSTYWNSTLNLYQFDPYAFRELPYEAFRVTFCSAWLGAMMATGIAYYILTSNHKTKLFKLQLFCVLSATIYDVSEMTFEVFLFHGMITRSEKGMDWTIAAIWLSFGLSLDHLIPLFADFILLFRISAFFPYPVYSKRIRFYIFTPFILFNVLRIILCILIFISSVCYNLIGLVWEPGSSLPYFTSPLWINAAQNYLIIAELIMGSIFCFIASSILLFKAYKLSRSQILSKQNQKNIKRRMQFFIEALLMCFIPPFLLNLVAVIQLLGPFDTYAYTYFKEIQTSNVNISVVFSILANAWPQIRDGLMKEAQKETTAGIQQEGVNVNQ